MALVEEPVLRQTITSQTRSNSIRMNKGLIILDVGASSSCTIEVKMMNGTWIPVGSADGAQYAYTNDIAIDFNGHGREYSINVGTYSADVVIELHSGH